METTDFSETPGGENQATSFVRRQVESWTTQLGVRIGSVASDMHNVAGELRQNPALGIAAGAVDQGAEMVERFGRYVQETDAQRLLRDMDTLARRQPLAVASGAMIAGFAAARLLKTSSARRYGGGERYAT